MKRSTHYIRVSAIILACAILFSSCSGEVQNTATDTETDTAASTETETAIVIEDNLPELNFDGQTVSILHFGDKTASGNDTSDWDNDADVVGEAVKKRDYATEDRLNVLISYTAGSDDWYDYPAEIELMVRANDCPYDIVFLESAQCFRMSLEGYFRELSQLPYVDLDQKWWYKDFMDGGAISSSKSFFLTGAFSISTLEGASATLFNKQIYDTYFGGHDELYDIAENKEWTYDKFLTICRDIYRDLNGSGTADDADIYGLFNRGIKTVNYASMSTGLSYINRDSDGLPVLEIYSEDSLKWVEYLYSIMHNDNISYSDENINGIDHFAKGSSLFFLGSLSEYTDHTIRAMDDPYGVLPMPVLDENHDYMSAAATVNGQSAALPSTLSEEKMDICGAVLESLSIEAYRTVVPAWYEIALKNKHADTRRDADMIDIIYDSIDTSFIMMADKLLGTGTFFWEMLGNAQKSPGEFASYYEKNSKLINIKWKSMIKSFEELEF